jgi:hypothetical protein
MYELLKPGGWIAHTIDLNIRMMETTGLKFLEAFLKKGFIFDEGPRVKWKFAPQGEPILLEPLEIVFRDYPGRRADMWVNLRPIPQHFGTILTLAHKPHDSEVVRPKRHPHTLRSLIRRHASRFRSLLRSKGRTR